MHQNLNNFAGEPLTVLDKVYESEYTTAFGNRAIALITCITAAGFYDESGDWMYDAGLHAIRDIAGELGVGVYGPNPEQDEPDSLRSRLVTV